MSQAAPLRVFVSYSHDSRQHADRVAALSARLRRDGIDCQIDQYYVRPPDRWVVWMNRQVAEADTILVICTEIYRQRFEREQPPTIGRGVRWESLLMQNHLYRAGAVNDKILPVLFSRDGERHIPDVLYAFEWACVDPDDVDSEAYHELVRKIRRKPARPMPPLGAAPLTPLDVQPGFFEPEPDADSPVVRTHRLPPTGPDLFGRRDELRRLSQAWNNPHTNVITLVAFGGVGKTALVNHWLARIAKEGYRGARRVYDWSAYSQGSKERVTSADQFIDDALRFFGDDRPPGDPIEVRAVRLAEAVRRERSLLILDGIESLQYPPGPGEGHIKDPGLRTLVRELAAQNPGLCVITTRVRVSDLAGFETSTCPRIDLELLDPPDGARLLASLGVQGPEDELRAGSESFGGHALALTLLGTFLRDACGGDVRRTGEIGPLAHQIEHGGHARRVMESYETWLGDGPERQILRMLGLFDRPAEPGALRALRREPPIPGLSERIAGLDERGWQEALVRLRHARLVLEPDECDRQALDAHPLVREHFGEKLRGEDEAAWRAGHDRLFEYYRGEGCPKELPDTLEEMAPLFAAVQHGCAAGRHQEALDEVYWTRIKRKEEFYSSRKLGAFGPELAALSGFFDPPWSTPVAALSEADKGFVLNEAGFDLRALGRLAEAVEPMKAGLDADVTLEDWKNAAAQAGNLSEL